MRFVKPYNIQKRVLSCLIVFAFSFLIVLIKLFVVQVVNSKHLQLKAMSQWTRDLSISGLRGNIFDCNGEVLATSYHTYAVYVRANAVKEPEKVASKLSEKLELDREKVLSKVVNKKVSESLIKTQVEVDIAKDILTQNLDGVYLSEVNSRFYPYQDMLTSVLGFTDIDSAGQAGLERYYNPFLTGINGTTFVESTITGREISNATTSFLMGERGCDVYLTIDSSIQLLLENIAKRALIEQKAKGIGAIVMDATNGEIKAMVTLPSFDLNNPPRDDVATLLELSKNTSIVDVYEPGSTFKLFTLAAALSENITREDEVFYDPGYRIVDGEKIKCWRTRGHGRETLVEGLCNSCNSVFMDLGLRLGKDKLYSYLSRFGFGQATGVDFAGESSGIMMDKNFIKNVDLARISFGQAVAVTPLQMIRGVCAVLDGTLYQPRFIQQIVTPDGHSKKVNSIPVAKVLDESICNRIRQMMESVVSTKGLYSFVEGYRIGGKTGTAQKYEDGHIANGKYVSSFVGCFPVDKPQYVLLFCVNEPSAGAYYGSVVAAPYGKQFFSGLFGYLGVKPTHLTEDMLRMQANIEVPNLVGLSVTQATSLLKKLKLEYEIDGEGDYISWQSVASGEMLFAGAIVELKT